MLPQDASLFHFSSMLSPAGACKAAYDSPDAQGQRAAGDAAAGREGAGRGQPCPGSCHQDPAEVANPDAPYACAGTCLQWGVAMCPLCICLPMSPQFTPVHLHFPVHDGPLVCSPACQTATKVLQNMADLCSPTLILQLNMTHMTSLARIFLTVCTLCS